MPDNIDFPRVLILCHEPINRVGGGGVTMGNLFRGWPHDALAQIWAHHRFEIDEEVCPYYLRLGEHKMPGDSWVPNVVRRQRKLVKRIRSLIRPGMQLDYEHVLTWVRDFGPDVIYSQATPYPMYTWWLPRWLSRDLNIPLVNHIMDDWPTSVAQEWLPVYRQIMSSVLCRQLTLSFEAAACNLAICQPMANAFQHRYGVSFVPFHNMIDLAHWSQPTTDYALQGNGFRVVYLGALAENTQLFSLRDVAEAISSMAQRGVDISLTIHTGLIQKDYYDQYLDGLPGVSYGGEVAREDLCTCLAAADLLVIPVNFGEQGAHVRYSMPTKVPEYMASGAPVLVYAPGTMPPAAYARDEGWGYVVDYQDSQELEQALLALMNSEELRTKLGQRGRELALRNHDARIVREEFRHVMRKAVEERSRA
jgi:glycosyltransferase involved in cell wall biosynthesis